MDDLEGKPLSDGELCECGGRYYFSKYCGAYVCEKCSSHKGLGRCFCGWRKGQKSEAGDTPETPEGEDSDYFGDEPVDEEGFYID